MAGEQPTDGPSGTTDHSALATPQLTLCTETVSAFTWGSTPATFENLAEHPHYLPLKKLVEWVTPILFYLSKSLLKETPQDQPQEKYLRLEMARDVFTALMPHSYEKMKNHCRLCTHRPYHRNVQPYA